MRSRFVRKETTRLPLTDGDWLVVKTRLNHGEQTDLYTRMSRITDGGPLRVNPLEVGRATVAAYLVDWSLVDEDGAPMLIRGEPIDFVLDALNALEPESFVEIRDAIDAHIGAVAAARAQEKKVTTGEPAAVAT